MLLTYEAINAEGQHSTDTVEAADVKEAVDQLRRRGLYVSRIAEGRGRAVRRAPAANTRKGVRLPLKTTAVFTRQMAMLFQAGSSVVPAIAAIGRQMENPQHTALLQEIVDDLEQGVTLSDAFRKHPRTFDPVYCAVVAAGEASATLTQMFERLSLIVGKRRALRNQILGAVAYPVLLIMMSFHIVAALLFFVIPRFGGMFSTLGVEPPASTKFLLWLSAFLAGYWPVLIALVIALIIGTVAVLTSVRGRQWLTDIQLSVPILGRLRSTIIQGQIFRTMGMLLESGVGVLDTFELARESTKNRRFQKLFDELEESVTGGGTLATAFEESKIVQPFICQAIRTGEDSGNLGGALTYAADLLDETNTEVTRTVMKLIEPIILMVLGVVVGTVAVSLFLPLFDMTAAMH